MRPTIQSTADGVRQWPAQAAPVGHFTVLRALPIPGADAVGPFVFLDHFGPAPASPETLPAHPHAGIEVMTYLLSGANRHRDSAGHQGTVQAGGAQWMRAGRGILHAETNLPELGPVIHGLQIWARLPLALQDDPPQYRAIQADEVPRWTQDGAELRLVGGRCRTPDGERQGPIQLGHACVMLHISLPAGGQCQIGGLDPSWEHGLYAMAGSAALAAEADRAHHDLARGAFAALPAGASGVSLRAASASGSELMLLGGEAAARPLRFGGPFVYDSLEGLQKARERYFAGEMGTLDGVPF